MMHARNGWQEIVNDTGLRTYMAIFTPDGDDNWEEVAGYFQPIDEIVRRFRLEAVANVSISAGVLTIAFHTLDTAVPDDFKRAGESLIRLLVNTSKDRRR